MNGKLVSVIVPTYNGEKHIAATLNSIINQDYENLEIIVVNDASTDKTLNIAEEILQNSGRKFKIINHEKNSGVSTARNTGIKNSSGEYVWFCDGDDLAEKNFVSSLYKKAENENADIVFCNYVNFFEDEDRREVSNIFDFNSEKTLSGKELFNVWIKNKNFWGTVWNCLFIKNFILQNKIRFFDGCRNHEDGEFVIKSVISASKIAFEKQPLYFYVQSSKNSEKYKNSELFEHGMLAIYRATRYVLRHTENDRAKNYVMSFFIARMILEKSKLLIRAGNKNNYDKFTVAFRHKKLRSIMLSTAKFIFSEPELFCKSLMLLYVPNLYYKLRSK